MHPQPVLSVTMSQCPIVSPSVEMSHVGLINGDVALTVDTGTEATSHQPRARRASPGSRQQIYKHTPSATLILIFPGICGTYLVTAVHLVKRIFVTNLLEICTHISGRCKCIHTKGYCMHTSTKYPPIYPPMTIYSHEGCLVHTYSKYSPTYTYCVLCRIIEHLLQMS